MPQSNPPSLFDDILSFWEVITQLPELKTEKRKFEAGLNLSTRTKPLPPLASISVGKKLDKNGKRPIELRATPKAFAGADANLITETNESGVLKKIDAGYTFGANAGVQTALKFSLPGISLEVKKDVLFGNSSSAILKLEKQNGITTLEVGGQAATLIGLDFNIRAQIDPTELEKQLSEKPDSTEVLKQLGTLSTQILGINYLLEPAPTSDPLPPHIISTPTPTPTPQEIDASPKTEKYPQFSDDEKKEIFNYIDQAAQLGLKQKINEGDESKYFDHLMDKIDDKKAKKIKNAYDNFFMRASIQLFKINKSNGLPIDQKIKLFDFLKEEKGFKFIVENDKEKIDKLDFIIKGIIFKKKEIIDSIDKIIADNKKEREEEREEEGGIEGVEVGEEKQQNENENEPLLNPKHPSKNVPSSFMGKIYTALSSSYTNFKQLIRKLKPPSPTFVVRGYEKLSQLLSNKNQKSK
jgi:hypothetical protein